MGKATVALLVTLAALAAPLPTARAAAAEIVVRAENYDAFWLWAGVRPHASVANARTLYVLQGEIGPSPDGGVRLRPQGASRPGPHAQELWLVYRVRSLAFTPEILQALIERCAQWRAQAGPFAGLQLDFDAGTKGLAGYAAFLRDVRAALPADYRLGVTGLMDWASQGRPEDLDALAGVVSEINFQTYRGRATIPDINAYLRRLGRLRIPFKLGLAEGAIWPSPGAVERDPNFKGYVVFLQNPAR